jgi:hypothetical protein
LSEEEQRQLVYLLDKISKGIAAWGKGMQRRDSYFVRR